MPEKPGGPSLEGEEVLGSNPGDWEKKSNKKDGVYFELNDSVQEKKESEPNYDHIVEVLANFQKEQKEGNPKDHVISHEVFEQDGFSGLSAEWWYGYISGQGDGYTIRIIISPSPESWTDEDKRNSAQRFSKLLGLLMKRGVQCVLAFPPEKVQELEEDDPFSKLKFKDY